jgi:MFS-type transporter involved in bile tolerance (Atg22 family)
MAEWNQLDSAPIPTDDDDILPPLHEPPFVPFCCGHFVKSNGEETPVQRGMIHGLALDVYGRATIGMSSIFLGPALLSLANQAAGGCDDCTIRGLGRPSSLLTNMSAVSGFLGCIALPFFGSIIDHTSLRKAIGLYTGIGMIVLKSVECIALRFPKLWLYIAATQIASSVTFYVHLTATYAYLSELSTIPSQQSYYNTSFFVIMYISTLIFMIEVIGMSSILPEAAAVNEDVRTARLALVITVATCAPCFLFSWLGTRCFPHRPAIRNVPPGQSVYSAGFHTLRTTVHHLSHPLRCLLASVALSESAANAIIVVSTTYMKQVLHMDAHDSTYLLAYNIYMYCLSSRMFSISAFLTCGHALCW